MAPLHSNPEEWTTTKSRLQNNHEEDKDVVVDVDVDADATKHPPEW